MIFEIHTSFVYDISGQPQVRRQCDAMQYLIMVDCVGVCGAYVCMKHMVSYISERYDTLECEYHTYPERWGAGVEYHFQKN